jgi:mRNA-degrading endonuclease YafQ of YafQ-DinJ toxin-antitoxin module
LLPPDEALNIPELGRSGKEVRLCYSLKSVEPNDAKPKSPWAVRQVALYHSFDLETGKAFWIVVKGSHLIRDRVKAATNSASAGTSELASISSTASSFAATLAMHLILCDWCDEDWRWYLTFLEKRLQELTRRATVVDIPKAPSFVEPDTYQEVEPQPTLSFGKSLSGLAKRTPSAKNLASSLRQKTKFRHAFPQPAIPMSIMDQSIAFAEPVPPPGVDGANFSHSSYRDEVFSARTLQQVQVIEDKTNEIMLILEANVKIVKSIKDHYLKLFSSDSCPEDLKINCKVQVTQFERRIDNIVRDLEIQHSSAQTLLRLLENRKSLVSEIQSEKRGGFQ